MSDWPSGLPEPQISSYTLADEYNVIRTEMESGPARQARRSSHYMSVGSMTMTMTPAQMTTFRSVVPDSDYGAEWINGVPIDTGLGAKSHRIRLLKVSHTVLFPQDGLYKVTIQFETDEHL